MTDDPEFLGPEREDQGVRQDFVVALVFLGAVGVVSGAAVVLGFVRLVSWVLS